MFKKSIAGLLVLAMTTTSVNAMEAFYAASGRDGINVYVHANTTQGVRTNTNKYHLKKGKLVDYVEIRLREGLYDETDSTSDGFIELTKINNPRKTAKGTWKWFYE